MAEGVVEEEEVVVWQCWQEGGGRPTLKVDASPAGWFQAVLKSSHEADFVRMDKETAGFWGMGV
jgi:hypothetical protein